MIEVEDEEAEPIRQEPQQGQEWPDSISAITDNFSEGTGKKNLKSATTFLPRNREFGLSSCCRDVQLFFRSLCSAQTSNRYYTQLASKLHTDLPQVGKTLQFNLLTLRFVDPAVQQRHNRHVLSKCSFTQQLVCIVLPCTICLAAQFSHCVHWYQVGAMNVGYLVFMVVLFALYIVACCYYLWLLRKLANHLSMIAVLNLHEFRLASEKTASATDNGRQIVDLLGSSDVLDKQQVSENKKIVDGLINWSIAFSTIVYALFFLWMAVYAFLELFQSDVTCKASTLLCFDEQLPLVSYLWQYYGPVIIAVMMPVPFSAIIAMEVANKIALSLIIKVSGEFEILTSLLKGNIIIGYLFGFLAQWIITRQYHRIFVYDEVRMQHTLLFERQAIVDRMASEGFPTTDNENSNKVDNNDNKQIKRAPDWHLGYSLVTLRFDKPDTQQRFDRYNVLQFDSKIFKYILLPGAFLIVMVYQFLNLSQTRPYISTPLLIVSAVVFLLPSLALLLLAYFLTKIETWSHLLLCSDIYRTSSLSEASSESDEVSKAQHLSPVANIDAYVWRVKVVSGFYMYIVTAAFAVSALDQAVSSASCQLFCLGSHVPAVPIVTMWVGQLYLSLLIPYQWVPLAVHEIIVRPCITYIMFHFTSNITVQLDVQTFIILICLGFMNLMAIWSVFRLQNTLFVSQDLFMQAAIVQEEKSIASNYIWHLI